MHYRGPWSEEEDIILLQAQLDNGNKWSEIVKQLKGRSENSVKNRYNILRKKCMDSKNESSGINVSDALKSMNEKTNEKEHIFKLLEEKKAKGKFVIYVS